MKKWLSMLLTITMLVNSVFTPISALAEGDGHDDSAIVLEGATEANAEDFVNTSTADDTDEITEDVTNAPAEDETDDSEEVVTDAPAEEVTDDPAEVVTDAPAEEATDDPAVDVTDEPAEGVTDTPVEDVTNEPAEGVTDTPAGDVTDEPAGDVTNEPVGDDTDTPDEDVTDMPTDEGTDAPDAEVTEEPDGEEDEQPEGSVELTVALSVEQDFLYVGETVRVMLAVEGGTGAITVVYQVGEEETDPRSVFEDADVLDFAPQAAGDYTITAVVADEAGQTETASVNVIVAEHDTTSMTVWTNRARNALNGLENEEDWRENMAAVALSQVGYAQSATDFTLEGGVRRFYSVYGDWYGDAYAENWEAMFVSFSAAYAKVQNFPRTADVNELYASLNQMGVIMDATSYDPEKGDIVFFQDGGVGIVYEVSGSTVRVVRGGNEVVKTSYAASDSAVISYASMAALMMRGSARPAMMAAAAADDPDTSEWLLNEQANWFALDQAEYFTVPGYNVQVNVSEIRGVSKSASFTTWWAVVEGDMTSNDDLRAYLAANGSSIDWTMVMNQDYFNVGGMTFATSALTAPVCTVLVRLYEASGGSDHRTGVKAAKVIVDLDAMPDIIVTPMTKLQSHWYVWDEAASKANSSRDYTTLYAYYVISIDGNYFALQNYIGTMGTDRKPVGTLEYRWYELVYNKDTGEYEKLYEYGGEPTKNYQETAIWDFSDVEIRCFVIEVTDEAGRVGTYEHYVLSTERDMRYDTMVGKAQEITGIDDLGAKIAAIAQSQVGYAQIEDFILANGIKDFDSINDDRLYYSIYSDWFGRAKYGAKAKAEQYSYADGWNTQFIAFCANLAGVEENVIPLTDSAAQMLSRMKSNKLYIAAGDVKPSDEASAPDGSDKICVGDLVFFGSEENPIVGIITSVGADGLSFQAVIGDSDRAVEQKSYSVTDAMGFGSIDRQVDWDMAVAKIVEVEAENPDQKADYLFFTLEAAIKAVENGQTIALLKDITIPTVSEGKSYTLDMADKAITADVGNRSVLTISSGDVAIKNGFFSGNKANANLYNGVNAVLEIENANVTIKDVTFSGNSANYTVYAGANANLAVEDVSFTDNTGLLAGGIYVQSGSGETKLTGVTMTGNHATNDNVRYATAGAIVYETGASMTLDNVTVTSNDAKEFTNRNAGGVYIGTTGFAMSGGAIHSNTSGGETYWANDIYVAPDTMPALIHPQIMAGAGTNWVWADRNVGYPAVAAIALGGEYFLTAGAPVAPEDAIAKIERTEVVGDQTFNSEIYFRKLADAIESVPADPTAPATKITLLDSAPDVITERFAEKDSMVVDKNFIIDLNGKEWSGSDEGAVLIAKFTDAEHVDQHIVTVLNGKVTHGNRYSAPSNIAAGGISVTNATLTLDGVTFEYHNTNYGGAVYLSEHSVGFISNSVFANNAANFGAGIYHLGGDLKITNTRFMSNTGLYEGAGVYYKGTGTLTIDSASSFTDNVGRAGAGVEVAAGTAKIAAQFSGNTNDGINGDGGTYEGVAINAGPKTHVEITGSTISGHTAVSGSVVYLGGSFALSGVTMKDNTAKSGGYALKISLSSSEVETDAHTITDAVITGNNGFAAPVYVSNSGASLVSVSGGTIANNSSTKAGAMYVTLNGKEGSLIMTGTVIEQNEAQGEDCLAGGLYLKGAKFELSGVQVSGNRAVANAMAKSDVVAGGINAVSATSLTISGSTITGNSVEAEDADGEARIAGALLATSGSKVTLQSTKVSDNTASAPNATKFAAGGVVIDSTGFTMSGDSAIISNQLTASSKRYLANDVYVSADKKPVLLPANEMNGAEEDYVWYDSGVGTVADVSDIKTPANNTKVFYLTAMSAADIEPNMNVLNVATGELYASIGEAIEAANGAAVRLKIIAGAEEGDADYGTSDSPDWPLVYAGVKSYYEKATAITTNVEIDMNGRTIYLESGSVLFTVKDGGSLTIRNTAGSLPEGKETHVGARGRFYTRSEGTPIIELDSVKPLVIDGWINNLIVRPSDKAFGADGELRAPILMESEGSVSGTGTERGQLFEISLANATKVLESLNDQAATGTYVVPIMVNRSRDRWANSKDDETYGYTVVTGVSNPRVFFETRDDVMDAERVLCATRVSMNGVYWEPTAANSAEDGSVDEPAKSLTLALELLKAHNEAARGSDEISELDGIYLIGTYTVSGTQELSLEALGITDLSEYGDLIAKNGAIKITRYAREVNIGNKPMFSVPSGATLILGKGITLDGAYGTNVAYSYSGSIVKVSGALEIHDGATLQNNAVTSGDGFNNDRAGGAVYAVGSSAKVLMDGGVITGNRALLGGGMYLGNGATLTMSGGTIRNNVATGTYRFDSNTKSDAAGGGVALMSDAKMIFSGGSIEYNSALCGGGIALGTGEYFFASSGGKDNLTMTGGKVNHNSATHKGGGIFIQSSYQATISGGEIGYNSASDTEYMAFSGGGIYYNGYGELADIPDARLYLKNALIENNHAGHYGGGFAGCPSSEAYVGYSAMIYGNTSNSSQKTPSQGKDDVLIATSAGQSYNTVKGTWHTIPVSRIAAAAKDGTAYRWKLVDTNRSDYAAGDYADNSLLTNASAFKSFYTENVEAVDGQSWNGVWIHHNTARYIGGGVGGNGYVSFEDNRDEQVTVTKNWEGNRPSNLKRITIYLLNKNAKGAYQILTQNDIVDSVTFNGLPTDDVIVVEAGVFNDNRYVLSALGNYGDDVRDEIAAIMGAEMAALGVTDYVWSDDDSAPYTAIVTDHGDGSFEITNTVVCSLTIEKQVEGPANENDEFTFTVTLTSDRNVDGTYEAIRYDGESDPVKEQVSFENGEALVILKAGQRIVIKGLPEGALYEVSEASDDRYTTESEGDTTGTIESGKQPCATFTNTRKTGGLSVSKTVVGKDADRMKKFSFTVTLDDLNISGTYGDMLFDKGVATFTLAHGESVTAEGLPTGISYTVVEKTDGDYTTTATGETGEIEANVAKEAAFTNTRKTGGLTVSKTVAGKDADRMKKFSFKVTLDDLNISGTYGDMIFDEGIATFELANGQSVMAEGLPTGITYTVVEESDDEYTTTMTGETGDIQANVVKEAAFTNTRKTDGLTVVKTVVGKDGDQSKRFTFTVTLNDTSISGTYGDMLFDKGVATFTLAHGESATAEGLPTGIEYTVAEAADDDYSMTADGETGTITENGNAVAAFVNTRKTGDLMVSKTVEGKDGDMSKRFSFKVTLDDESISGTYGEMIFANGVAVFALTHGQSKTAKGLPTDITYTVEETANDDYAVEMIGETGRITEGMTKEAAFTNTRKTGDLTVTKTVTGTAGDTEKQFTFTVTLDDTSISGAYGDMTFVSGVATFMLTHGQSKTAKDLPIGTTYTVKETGSDDYTVSMTGETGTITEGGKTAAFTNHKDETTTTPPTVSPSVTPTEEPEVTPTGTPTATPTVEPTEEPTEEPTPEVTEEPTAEPTEEPTEDPTPEATPTAEPEETPTQAPAATPTVEPKEEPTETPTVEPTEEPTPEVTEEPTAEPTEEPTPEVTATPVPAIPLTNLTGTKTWVDNNNADGMRPESIVVTLYANGVAQPNIPVWTNTDTNVWTYTFTRLPATTADGTPIVYTVVETPVEYYTGTQDGFNFTNTIVPKQEVPTIIVSGQKIWQDNDNAEDTRPGSITIELLRDGVVIATATVTAADNWAYTFTGLPEGDGFGNSYTYTVRERAVPGYYTVYDGTNVINVLIPADVRPQPDLTTFDDVPVARGLPPFQQFDEGELADMFSLFDYGVPLYGMLLGTGLEVPMYPFVFGGCGVLAIVLLIVFGRKKKED